MAGENRTATRDLTLLKSLQKNPYSYGFYQAVRLLENYFREYPQIGKSLTPKKDPIRFSQPPSTKFATSTLETFKLRGSAAPILASNFFGCFGPNGPLPLHITEYALDRSLNASDKTFAAFMDIFHHRMISFYYRAWANTQPAISFDRPEEDRYATYIGSLIGIGMSSFRNRDGINDRTKLYYAGLLSSQTKHASGLETLLTEYFKMPVQLEQFIGQWLDIPEDGRTLLGMSKETATLGWTSAIGEKAWDCQHKFRIVMGPLSFKEYAKMLPGGESIKRLHAIVRNYIGDEIAWDLELKLKKDDVPPMCLGKLNRLSWISKLRSKQKSAQSLILDPNKHVN